MCIAHFYCARSKIGHCRCFQSYLQSTFLSSLKAALSLKYDGCVRNRCDSGQLYEEGAHAMSRMIIVGSGVVGQATGKGFTKKGHSVGYVDINPQTIAKLRGDGLNAMLASEVDWNAVDVVLLAVSTPS